MSCSFISSLHPLPSTRPYPVWPLTGWPAERRAVAHLNGALARSTPQSSSLPTPPPLLVLPASALFRVAQPPWERVGAVPPLHNTLKEHETEEETEKERAKLWCTRCGSPCSRSWPDLELHFAHFFSCHSSRVSLCLPLLLIRPCSLPRASDNQHRLRPSTSIRSLYRTLQSPRREAVALLATCWQSVGAFGLCSVLHAPFIPCPPLRIRVEAPLFRTTHRNNACCCVLPVVFLVLLCSACLKPPTVSSWYSPRRIQSQAKAGFLCFAVLASLRSSVAYFSPTWPFPIRQHCCSCQECIHGCSISPTGLVVEQQIRRCSGKE